jgi:4-carboxymuconolactone decarboxylase
MTASQHSPSGYAVAPERMPRIPAEQMTDAQKKAAADIAEGPRGSVRGPFIAIMRNPAFMEPAQKLGEYLRFRCKLDKRISEMAAIITARHWTQQYEWQAHAPQALEAGLKQSIIDAIADGRRPRGMADDEEIVYDLISEVLVNRGASDETYARAVAKFGEHGIIDLLGVAGYYAMLAMIMNVARTAIPDGRPLPLAPLPQQLCRSE